MRPVPMSEERLKAKPYIRVLFAKHRAPAIMHCRSDNVAGCWTHWIGTRSLICRSTTEDVCDCQYKGNPRKWYGFLAGIDPKDNRRAVLQIPEFTFAAWKQSSIKSSDLNGYEITLSRVSTHKHAECVVNIRCINRTTRKGFSEEETLSIVLEAYSRFTPRVEQQEERTVSYGN